MTSWTSPLALIVSSCTLAPHQPGHFSGVVILSCEPIDEIHKGQTRELPATACNALSPCNCNTSSGCHHVPYTKWQHYPGTCASPPSRTHALFKYMSDTTARPISVWVLHPANPVSFLVSLVGRADEGQKSHHGAGHPFPSGQ